VSSSDVTDLISDSIVSFKTEIQGMIREALFPTQEGRSQGHVVSDLPEHAETKDDVVDLDDQDDSVSFCGDPAPKHAWSKERAVTSEQNHSSFTLPQYSSPTDQSHEKSESTTNNDNSTEEGGGSSASLLE
jgi:hypothetical protein